MTAVSEQTSLTGPGVSWRALARRVAWVRMVSDRSYGERHFCSCLFLTVRNTLPIPFWVAFPSVAGQLGQMKRLATVAVFY